MKIGFDGSVFVGPTSGIPNYAFNLLSSLSSLMPKTTFYVFAPHSISLKLGSNVQIITPKNMFGRSHLAWLLSYPFTKICRTLDLFISPNGYLPPWLSVPVLNCVHDFTYLIFPKTMTRRGYWTRWLLQKHWIKRARWIVANSMQTADEVLSECLREVDCVVRPAVSDDFSLRQQEQVQKFKRERGLPEDFILFVGTFEPRKNIRSLIAAFEQLTRSAEHQHLRLLLVGSKGWGREEELLRSQFNKNPNIVTLSDVRTSELPLLYSAARVFVLPSLYEGFGIPLLEARACGSPMIATDLPATREAGGSKPYYCQPTSQAISEALECVLAQPQRYRDQQRPEWTWTSEVEQVHMLIQGLSE